MMAPGMSRRPVSWRRQAAIVTGGTSERTLKADAADETARTCMACTLYHGSPLHLSQCKTILARHETMQISLVSNVRDF